MSDQDFFFDEEEEAAKPAPASTTKSASRPAAAKAASPQSRTSAPASSGFFDQSVSLAVAALMTVIGLLVGVIGGFLIAPDGASVPTSPATTNQLAPALSEDQIQSGEMPAGHPDISSMATDTDSQETTSN